jgi:hypothetical protein
LARISFVDNLKQAKSAVETKEKEEPKKLTTARRQPTTKKVVPSTKPKAKDK